MVGIRTPARAVKPGRADSHTSAPGYVLHEGQGFDGRPGVVAAVTHSDNRKTGDMVPVYLLPRAEPPEQAGAGGRDRTVCGDCPSRAGGGCSVNAGHGPPTAWLAWRAGRYPRWGGSLAPSRGRMARWGAYGEPALIPLGIARRLSRAAAGWTGYTHAWHRVSGRYRRWLMASVQGERGLRNARALGWRTYRVRGEGDPLLPGEAVCPGSDERELGGHERLTCERCGACDGSRRPGGRRVSFAVVAHGDWYRQAAARIERPSALSLHVR